MIVKPEIQIGTLPDIGKEVCCLLCGSRLDFQLTDSFGEGVSYRCQQCKIIIQIKKLESLKE